MFHCIFNSNDQFSEAGAYCKGKESYYHLRNIHDLSNTHSTVYQDPAEHHKPQESGDSVDDDFHVNLAMVHEVAAVVAPLFFIRIQR